MKLRTSPGRGEIVLAPLIAAVAAAFIYGRHVTEGGLYFDDWRTAEAVRRADGLFDLDRTLTAEGLNSRPLQEVVVWLQNSLLGLNTAGQILAGVLLSALASAAFYVVLRQARAPVWAAAGAGLLALVFPFATTPRMWATVGITNWAVIATFVGGACALRGAQRAGPAGWRLAAGGAAGYAAGVLLYEAILGLIGPLLLATLLLHRSRRTTVMVGVQFVVTCAATLITAPTSGAETQPSLSATLDHLTTMLEQSWQILGRIVMPFEGLWHVGAVGAVLVLAAGALLARRRPEVRFPLGLAVAGLVTVVACYVLLAPAIDFYVPLAAGQGDRTNVGAQYGWALLVVGLAAIVAAVARRWMVAPLLVAILALTWTYRVSDTARDWDQAWVIQQDVIATLKAGATGLPPNTTLLGFGVPRATTPDVPVFIGPEDFGPALRISLRNDTLNAVPVQGDTKLVCGRSGPETTGGFIPPQTGARYGATVFFDYPGRRVLPVPSRASCRKLAPGLASGAINLAPSRISG